jgi:ATP-dependent Lon protease
MSKAPKKAPKKAAKDLPILEIDEENNLPAIVPVIALRDMVVFPGTVVPIHIHREKSIRLIEEHMPKNKRIVVATQRDSTLEDPPPDQIHSIGVVGEVTRLVRQPEHGIVIILQAEQRVRLVEFSQTEPFNEALVEAVQTVAEVEKENYWTATIRNLRDSAIKLIELNPEIPDEAKMAVANIDDPELLMDFLASNISIETSKKQRLLEEVQLSQRMKLLQESINNQLHIGELQQKLRDDMQSEFTENQRRALLREQLRRIQQELGESSGTEEQIDELREKLEKAKLPETAKAQVEHELKRLEYMPVASSEYSVIISYLETIAELPWSVHSEDQLDLKKARAILDRDHHGLDKVKKRLVEYLAVRKLNPDGRGPILCLIGPPGVGKTSLGQSVADALGRKFARISLGGIRDEAEIRGHRRTYIGAMPGRLITELRRTGTNNPVIMLDEVDKLGGDFRGDPASALLEVLDPRQNHAFVDRYLDVPFDLSQVIFISTANYFGGIPGPLRDRMEIIEIPGYTDAEKLAIARDYLLKRQLQENGLTDKQCIWGEDALRRVIQDHTREAGVRELERKIGSVCRNIAAAIAAQERRKVTVTPKAIKEALGPPQYIREARLSKSSPGVVNGLAYTSVGGEVLHIEAIKYPGKGNVQLTGQLGDVMKESVQAAYSLVRNRAEKLGIDPARFYDTDIHVHVPAGAVPKDGPSAGLAMFTAIASLFTGQAVNNKVAMTGEVTLRGLALPIGGLKEKSLAALREGVETVLIPYHNVKDLEDIPAEAREKLNMIPVKNVDDVLKHALL